MIKNKRKGFTLVELVIVIAVIAILAAILIPVFASLIRKSNIDSDKVLAKNLNAAIEEYKEENGNKDLTFEEALKAAKLRGYILSSLNAKTKGFYFVWEDDTDQFILVEALLPNEAGNPQSRVEYSYKDGYGTMKKSWVFAIKDNKDIEKLENTHKYLGLATFLRVAPDFDSLNEFVNNNVGETIYVDSFDFSSGEGLVLNQEGQKITLDLTGCILSTGKTDEGGIAKNDVSLGVISGGAELIVKGGEIAGRGYSENLAINIGFEVYGGGTLKLDGVKVDTTPNYVIYGDKDSFVELNNCEIKCYAGPQLSGTGVLKGNTSIICDGQAISTSGSGNITVESGTYIAKTRVFACLRAPSAIIVKDGYFEALDNRLIYMNASGSGYKGVLIMGGMFKTQNMQTAKSFDQISVAAWKSYGGENVYVGRDKVTNKIVAIICYKYNNGSDTISAQGFLNNAGIQLPNVKWGAS